jgi:hypothetical protein
MAKRYYNLERETKAYLKACDERGISTFTSIDTINNFCLKQKALSRYAEISDPRLLTNVAAWFDASDLTTLIKTVATNTQAVVGDTVERWNDKSGNNRYVEQPVLTKQPILNITSGYNNLNFDGVDDGLYRIISQNLPLTVFVVCLQKTSSANDIIFHTGTAGFVLQFRQQGGGGVNCGGTATIAAPLNVIQLLGARTTTNQQSIRLNSSSELIYSGPTVTATTLGIANQANVQGFCDTRIFEVCLFSEDMSETKQSIVKNYLNCKYSIYL